MKFTRIEALAGVFCLLIPLAAAAQSSDPSNPATPASQNPTSTQTTPGLAHTNNGRPNTVIPESGVGSGETDVQGIKDREFLKSSAQGSMSEIQMGQLASDKGSNAEVKAFGQKMVTDHTLLMNNLKPFADKMGVPPPTALAREDQAELDKLNGLSGEEFDKEYVAYMMKDHAMDLKEFRKEAVGAVDPDLKHAVMKGEAVIEQHKRMIDKIGASMGLKVAA